MMNVGRLIHLARKQAGKTQREVAQGLCSTKYIYMIEKSVRQPSVEMLEAIGEKIGVDFFDYLPYESCEDPFSVKAHIDRFNLLRLKRFFDQLAEETVQAEQRSDFHVFPWNAEIVYNEALIKMYQVGDYEAAKAHSLKYLHQFDDPSRLYELSDPRIHPSVIRLYNLVAICDVFLGSFDEALARFQFLHEYLKQKKAFSHYSAIAISVNINYCQTIGKVDPRLQLEAVEELIEMQISSNKLDRLYLSYNIKGSALLALGEEARAIPFFRKAFFAGLALSEGNSLMDLIQENEVRTMMEKGIYKVDLISLIGTEP